MRRLLAITATAAALLAACGADTPAPGDGASATSAPTTVAAGAPDAIISLSPTATEMLFAVGAGDQVVAVDDQSNFPDDAPVTDLSGFQPNLEAIAAYEPDLVVLQGDTGDVVAGLDALGIDTLIQPAAITLDDTYAQIAELGVVTGHEDGAAAVVADMRSAIDGLVPELPHHDPPLTYYHELDPTLYSVTSQTFVGEVYALAGLVNVADPADASSELPGYPQLSAEYLVQADPDLVFLADTKCCDQNADTFAARPGFDGLTAVRNGRVILLDDDVASRCGPRVIDFLRAVVGATAAVPVA